LRTVRSDASGMKRRATCGPDSSFSSTSAAMIACSRTRRRALLVLADALDSVPLELARAPVLRIRGMLS